MTDQQKNDKVNIIEVQKAPDASQKFAHIIKKKNIIDKGMNKPRQHFDSATYAMQQQQKQQNKDKK